MIIDFENVNTRLAIGTGTITWIVALIAAVTIMAILGIDVQDPDENWGIEHPKYWQFEVIMNGFFLVIGFLILTYYFKKSGIEYIQWKSESITAGVIIMLVQFLLDTLVLVILLQNGFEYFYGVVTISYLLIPLWSYLIGWYWRVAKEKK